MRLDKQFYRNDALTIAKELLGKYLVRKYDNGLIKKYTISETEAYLGNGDKACHASIGMTKRNEIMFAEGGVIYVYLIYGMYWLINIVTGEKGVGEAVLLRGVEGVSGPGRLGKVLELNKSFYGECLSRSERLWIEDCDLEVEYTSTPRINIDYAGEPWVSKPWRFIMKV